jgi:hypothetical protein
VAPFVTTARAEVRDDIERAASWVDLELRLAAWGYRLERRARGLVITTGVGYAALSHVANASLPKMERHFGQAYATYERERRAVLLSGAKSQRSSPQLLPESGTAPGISVASRPAAIRPPRAYEARPPGRSGPP